MHQEHVLIGTGLVCVGIIIEQAGLVPRARTGAWTALSLAAVAYVVLRVLPKL